jgi:hypothetical protein
MLQLMRESNHCPWRGRTRSSVDVDYILKGDPSGTVVEKVPNVSRPTESTFRDHSVKAAIRRSEVKELPWVLVVKEAQQFILRQAKVF